MPRRNLILILAVLAAAVIVAASFQQYGNSGGDSRREPQSHPLDEVMQKIRDNYCRDFEEQRLVQGAIQGMVSSLDSYSSYVPPDKMDTFGKRVSGSNYGTGLRVELIDQAVVVIGPMVNSPAHQLGLRGGDRLVSIDGQSLSGLPIEQVRRMLDEGAARKIELAMSRGGDEKTIQLPRAEFPLESVTGLYRGSDGKWVHRFRGVNNSIAYVRVREFVEATPQDLSARLRELFRERPPTGLVLDLRDNPGGMLGAAVSVADMFMSKGVVVEVQKRGGVAEDYRARTDGSLWESVPLVVLVNAQTASAAEIVAGALWVNSRAVIVGTRTRGKGCVQTMLPLGAGLGQMNLTTAEYFLQGGLPISRAAQGNYWGVDPHPVVLAMHDEQLQSLRTRLDVIYRPTPETMPVGYSEKPNELLQLLMSLDTELSAGVELLKDTAEMDARLSEAHQMLSARKAAHAKADAR